MKYIKTFEDFINEANSNVNPSIIQKELRNKYKDYIEKLFIFDTNYGLELNIITIKHEKRGQGWAIKIIKDLIEYADNHDKIISLTPTDDFGSSVPRLIEFYKKFNFILNKGKNKDSRIKDTMIRYPKKKINK